MKPTLLDTDIVSELVRRSPPVTKQTDAYIRLWGPLKLSAITYFEALSGLRYRDARQQISRFDSIIALSEILPVTAESAALSAGIAADLRSRGLSIGTGDTLIAGVALANGLVLATNNTRHYERITGLELVNWTI